VVLPSLLTLLGRRAFPKAKRPTPQSSTVAPGAPVRAGVTPR